MAERDLILDIIEKRTGNGMRDAADDMDRLADRSEHAGSVTRNFNRDIELQRTKVLELSKAWASTGDDDTLKGLRKARTELNEMERVLKTITPESGRGLAGLFSNLGDIGQSLRGSLVPIAIGGVAALSPAIGAAIAGAVIGGVGAGGLIGGIAAATRDPRVQAAGQDFAATIGHSFDKIGGPFVQPVINSLGILAKAFDNLHLDTALAPLAKEIEPLAQAIGQFGQTIMPGFSEALRAAGPALQVIKDALPGLGASFSNMFHEIANSQGAMDGLRLIFQLIGDAAEGTGNIIGALGNAFHFLTEVTANVSGALEDLLGWMPMVGDGFRMINDQAEAILGTKIVAQFHEVNGVMVEGASDAVLAAGGLDTTKRAAQEAAAAANALAAAVTALNQTYSNQFNQLMSADQLNLKIAQDTLSLKEAVQQHGTSLSNNTQAGIQNQQMLLTLAQDYEQQREKASTSAAATQAASQKFREQIGHLEALAGSLGFTKGQIDALLGSYMALHNAPNIVKTITIKTYTTNAGAITQFNTGKAIGFDTGGWVPGPVGAPVPAIVHGGEYVLSHDMLKGRTSIPSLSSNGSGVGSTYNITVNVPPTANAAEVGRQVVESIREYERRSGTSWRS